MIETRGLTKRYGKSLALDGLDLEVASGEWLLYLGPNGAGKTTTLRMLMGLAEPTAGRARVLGFDPIREGHRLRRAVGYLPDDFEAYEFLSGREFLQFIGDMHGIERRSRDRKADHLLDLLDLADDGRRPTREYSHGMKKKLGLAAALIHDPRVLILDEPTAELDPRTSNVIRQVLRGITDRGAAVLMSTHILGTAEKHCDTVAILDRGRLIRCGTPEELLRDSPGSSLEDVFLQLTGSADEGKVESYLEGRDDR
ncbi:MAG: ABC transporter ATP-binding protein [Planctomycetota bacterium]|nr:ABC transporter ATP-binding protein [Planctomycetota bacterium]